MISRLWISSIREGGYMDVSLCGGSKGFIAEVQKRKGKVYL